MAMMEKRIIILVSNFLLLITFAHCTQQESNYKKQTLKPDEKSKIVNLKKNYYPKEYDQGIIGICNLFEANSLNKIVKTNYDDLLNESDEILIINKTSFCKMHIANGGKKGDFQRIEVGYLTQLRNEYKENSFIQIENFKSNRGVHLGMSIENFNNVFPSTDMKSTIIEPEQITIKIDDDFNVYSASYVFIDSKLVHFQFGYDED